MQPITYSLILNLAVLAACTAMAIMMNIPWLIVIAMILQTHALERFRNEDPDVDDEDDDQPMGFTADVK